MRGALVAWNKAVDINPKYVIEVTRPRFAEHFLSPEVHLKLGMAYKKVGEMKYAERGFSEAEKLGRYTTIGQYVDFKLRNLRKGFPESKHQ